MSGKVCEKHIYASQDFQAVCRYCSEEQIDALKAELEIAKAEAQIHHNFYMVAIEQRDAAYAELEIAREDLQKMKEDRDRWADSAVRLEKALSRMENKQ